ncbi:MULTISPECIES: class I SAM-dependent methyltransferase [unclassified Nostoc]|uniref:class I SAM-dependent methyltransferase n=1 Tax=unclassified Nostoc TaxID=2593658 RepID=UPI002AD29C2E|nr:class I SAM-dependent methyltransferase [Nostoc sp. DedQUE03]MDZ7976120.1 class I SAM-dependent methyltransferase [Nostoc sp. DedQUE03]MDZ8044096.1 class I SAM-dependent methyltransferase [Nostoc sp. DedQUE02]
MTATISFDRVSDIYDATRGLPPEISEEITDFILNLVSATTETKFYETGIGTGRIAVPIAKRGYSYTGVDISEKMLAELHQKLEGVSHKLTAIKGDATSLPFADNSFDVALTVHVFHLISAWKQALAEIRRVLKPGGIYLYTHGNMNFSKVNEDMNQGRFDFQQRWQDIIASYNYPLLCYGATEEEVLGELREQGANLETVVAAKWQPEVTVGKLLEYHTKKVNSHTWHIPDDIFARAIQDLQDWALQHYGSLDYDLSGERRFKIVVVRNWA